MRIEEPGTSVTLLRRVRDLADHEAWRQFVDRYAPRVFAWCRRHALQESDAADVTQEVLVKLVRAMRAFQHDPARGAFRAWLKTVTANAVQDFLRAARGASAGRFAAWAAERPPQAFDELAAAIESQHERELLAEAELRVRPRVRDATWQAYQLTAIENLPASEAASRLGLAVSDVYVAKSRIIKMLREEVAKLERAGE